MARWRDTEYLPDAPQSPRASLSADGRNRLTRRIHVEWDDDTLAQAAQDFLGYPVVQIGVQGSTLIRYLSRVTPHTYPYHFTTEPLYVGNKPLWCTGFDPTAQGMSQHDNTRADGYGKATHAEVSLTYDTLTYDVLEDSDVRNLPDDPFPHDAADTGFRYITRQWKPAGKVLNLGWGMMRTVPVAGPEVSLPIKDGVPLNVPAAELLYTWHQVPEAVVPFATIEVTQGAINSVAFDDFTAETVLLLSVELRRYWHPVGVRVVDITYRMKWLPNIDPVAGTPKGHNWVYRVVGGDLVLREVTSDGTNAGQRPYRKLPFKPLFRPHQLF